MARVDWDRAQRLYRLGQLTDREVADVAGCKVATLKKRVRDNGWTRDLSTQVAQATRAKLTQGDDGDDAAVEDAAEVAAGIVRTHRTHIMRGREVVDGLFSEMGEVGRAPQMIEQALRAGLDPEEIDINRILSAYELPSRAKSMGALAGALEKLIRAERTAYNLDEHKEERPFEKTLRELDEDGEGDT